MNKHELYHNHNYVYLLTSNIINRCGDSLDTILFTWLVYLLTNSAGWSAIIFGINQATSVIIQPFIGPLVENMNKKKVLVLSDIARVLLVLYILYVYTQNMLSPLILVFMTISISLIEAFHMPAGVAVIQHVLPNEHYDKGVSVNVSCTKIAAMLSQAIGFVILLIGCTKKGNIRISFKNFRFKKQLYKEIFRGGIPSLARQGLASLAMVAMNRLAGGYGDAAIAAMSIVSKIMNFFGAAVIGFGQGFQPVCGFNYGAKKYDRVKKAFWFSVKVTTVFMTVVAVFGFILSPYVIALFRRDDTDVIAIGSFAFRAQCISLPLSGFIVTANMYLQTIGRAKAATLTAMSRQFLFFVPALLLLVHFFGLTGVEISQAAADVAAFLFSMPICLKVLNIMMTEENKIQ